MSIGSVVRTIKSNTSKSIKEQFEFVRKMYWGSDGIWSDGYFVSTSGVSPEILTRYIDKQGKSDVDQTADLGLFAS